MAAWWYLQQQQQQHFGMVASHRRAWSMEHGAWIIIIDDEPHRRTWLGRS